MAYTPKIWKDLPDETTPIKATDLNHIETGIYNNSVDIGAKSELTTIDKTNLVKAINEIESSFKSLKDELFYKAGDTLVLPSGYAIVTGGHLTNGRKEIAFSIYTPKSMKNITSISVSGAIMVARQGGNYIVGSGSGMASVSLTASKKTDNCIYLQYNSSTEITTGTNNDVVAIAIGGATFTFSSTSVASDEGSSDLETI